MLQTLLESRARPTRRAGGTIVSVMLHATAITLAIVATARATGRPSGEPPEKTDIVYHRRVLLDPPKVVLAQPGTYGFIVVPPRTLIPPISIPDQMPPIDMSRPTTDPRDFEVSRLALGGGGASGGRSEGWSKRNDSLYTPATVEKAAMPRSGNPAPAYPTALRSAQIEGTVLAQFVVDTAGRAEPASISFRHASHPLFADAVRRALLASRYLPAVVNGRPVRQLVEQRFEFTLRQ